MKETMDTGHLTVFVGKALSVNIQTLVHPDNNYTALIISLKA